MVDQTFDSVAAADSYFTNDLVDLGAWTSGSTLDLLASLSETASDAGSGYGIDYMVGVDPPAVPEPSSLSLFGAAIAAALGIGYRRRAQRY